MFISRGTSSTSEKTQKLLELLESRYSEELQEVTDYFKLTQKVKDPLLKLYFDNIALDTSRHASTLRSLISLVTEDQASLGNLHLPLEELSRLRLKEKESRDAYLKCLKLAENDRIRLLIKQFLLDETHHLKLLTELLTLYTKSRRNKEKVLHCTECGYDLPKNITINMVPKDIENRINGMLLTIYCPRCNKPYYSTLSDDESKLEDVPCYS